MGCNLLNLLRSFLFISILYSHISLSIFNLRLISSNDYSFEMNGQPNYKLFLFTPFNLWLKMSLTS